MHKGHYRNYGAARVHQYLKYKGYSCSRRRINRLMKAQGIRAIYAGFQYPRRAKGFAEIADNHLAIASGATEIGQQWAGDMTHLKTRQGPMYLAAVIDLYSRKVVGWGFSRLHDADLVCGALSLATASHRVQAGCFFHSDQGSEYRSDVYRDALRQAGITPSMSRAGTPTDNAFVESFFGTLKKELVAHWRFNNFIECGARVIDYIRFYNEERLHSGLHFQSPKAYERQYLLCP